MAENKHFESNLNNDEQMNVERRTYHLHESAHYETNLNEPDVRVIIQRRTYQIDNNDNYAGRCEDRPERIVVESQSYQHRNPINGSVSFLETSSRVIVERIVSQSQTNSNRPGPQMWANSNRPGPQMWANSNRPVPQSQTNGNRPMPQAQTNGNRPVPQTQTNGKRPVPQTQTIGHRPVSQTQNIGHRPVSQTQNIGNRPLPPNPNAVPKRVTPNTNGLSGHCSTAGACRHEYSALGNVRWMPTINFIRPMPSANNSSSVRSHPIAGALNARRQMRMPLTYQFDANPDYVLYTPDGSILSQIISEHIGVAAMNLQCAQQLDGQNTSIPSWLTLLGAWRSQRLGRANEATPTVGAAAAAPFAPARPPPPHAAADDMAVKWAETANDRALADHHPIVIAALKRGVVQEPPVKRMKRSHSWSEGDTNKNANVVAAAAADAAEADAADAGIGADDTVKKLPTDVKDGKDGGDASQMPVGLMNGS